MFQYFMMFSGFVWIFMIFENIWDFFWIFWNFWDFWNLYFFLGSLRFLGLFSKLLKLLLNVIEVTTEHQKWPLMSTNSVKSSFFPQRVKKASAESQSPLQELEVSPRNGLYLLVIFTWIQGDSMSKVQEKRSTSKSGFFLMKYER